MLFLISPAKSLDYATPPHVTHHTQPLFVRQSLELMAVLKTRTPQQISALMALSDALVDLNVARYQAWTAQPDAQNAKQAVLAFDGDVYGGLNAKTLSARQLDWAQSHVCILSGLYGVLRPLDHIQPHRLEMGTALASSKGSNLYEFWGAQVTAYLNEASQAARSPVVVNLASQEYFKVVDRNALKARVVTCVFEELKASQYKVISFYAKRARGLMLRYAIENKVVNVKKLEAFQAEGYRFDAAASTLDCLVFRREQAQPQLQSK